MFTSTVSICLSRFGVLIALTVLSSRMPVTFISAPLWNLRTASATVAS
jgi:hypothetical protein